MIMTIELVLDNLEGAKRLSHIDFLVIIIKIISL